MTIQSVSKLADGTTLAKIGHGLMQMTPRYSPTAAVPDEVAFESIKASLSAVPPGVKMLINSGEFYGCPPNATANLDLIARFFEKYPEYADKAFLSVKGAIVDEGGKLDPDCSPEYLAQSVDNCLAHLKGFKKMDLYQPARVDPKVPIEETMRTLMALQKEGKFDYIGLSECGEKSLRRAAAVGPVAMIEIQISPVAYEEETKKVIAASAELGILIEAYGTLAHGLLTGALANLKDLPEGDWRRHLTQYQDGNIEFNLRIVDTFKTIATARKISPPQVAIAWVSALGSHIIPLPGSSRKARTEENLAACDVKLTEEEIAQIDASAAANRRGGRYVEGMEKEFSLWG